MQAAVHELYAAIKWSHCRVLARHLGSDRLHLVSLAHKIHPAKMTVKFHGR